MIQRVREKKGTKYETYCEINPDLTGNPLYMNDRPNVEDSLRITFTRFRVSSHRLHIEK